MEGDEVKRNNYRNFKAGTKKFIDKLEASHEDLLAGKKHGKDGI